MLAQILSCLAQGIRIGQKKLHVGGGMVRSVNRQERFVVLDVETTGLSPRRGDRVIEVGAIAIEGDDMIAEFNTLVQTPRQIPFQVSQIHGITDEMLIGKRSPLPLEVAPRAGAWIETRSCCM